MIGAFLLPIGIFWFGWTSRASVHWIVPILGTGLYSIGVFMLFQAGLKCVAAASAPPRENADPRAQLPWRLLPALRRERVRRERLLPRVPRRGLPALLERYAARRALHRRGH
jgi:hypothetical protein